MNRRQLLAKALKGQIHLMKLQKKYNWDRNTLLSAVVLLDDPLPFTLHFTAFMAVIEAQGTDEQRQEWIPRSERMEILGINKEVSR
jgi:acyl-CoA oxidase